jgi:hypothetical protein
MVSKKKSAKKTVTPKKAKAGAPKKKTPKSPSKPLKKSPSKPLKKSPPLKSHKSQKGRKPRMKCCKHCPDYEKCDDRGFCCDYCDFFLNSKCTFGKKKGIPSLDNQIELPDYRGDDYGIDDYEAYEPVYE